MDKQVLMGKRESIWADTSRAKDFMITMESSESILNLHQCFISDCIPPNKVAEFQKCLKGTNNIIWDMAFNGREADLHECQCNERNPACWTRNECSLVLLSHFLSIVKIPVPQGNITDLKRMEQLQCYYSHIGLVTTSTQSKMSYC